MKRHRRRRRSLPTEPVLLDIDKLSHEGRGIGHREGKVVFVQEALPGEQVSAQLTDRRADFEEALTLEVLRAAPERVTPPCEYARVCGGCSLQHMETGAQIRFKEAVLHEKLAHAIGNEGYERLPPVTGPVRDYRRKARLAVRYVQGKDRVLVGFREKRSSFITDMQDCIVLDPQVSHLLPELSALIGELKACRSIPQIEVAVGDAVESLETVALVFRHLQPLAASDTQRLIEFAETHRVAVYLQPKGPDTVHRLFPVSGPERLYYHLPDYSLSLAFHPMDFTQVNSAINRHMLAQAMTLLAPDKDDRILDLYCGLGNFTLPLARHCAHVCGVEGANEMVQRGYENAGMNGIANVEFHCADLSEAVTMTGRPWLKQPFDKVLLDPPRSGAAAMIGDIVSLKPGRIVYISCNPATLARDAALLEASGYRLRAAGVLDMFPHTAHVESMAMFTPEGESRS